MPNVTSDVMTAGPVPRVHVGQNINIATASVTTNDGSLTVQCMPLPAGARVNDVSVVRAGTVSLGAAAIYSTIGGTTAQAFGQGVAISGNIYRANGPGLGVRHTASANLVVKFLSVGISAETLRIIGMYDATQTGD